MRSVRNGSASWWVNKLISVWSGKLSIFFSMSHHSFLEEYRLCFVQEEEAEAKKAKEEEEAALEFEKWKGEFSVDAEGTTENEVQDGSQGLLSDFVEYIKVALCPYTVRLYFQDITFSLLPICECFD